jgi:hypothetical protein
MAEIVRHKTGSTKNGGFASVNLRFISAAMPLAASRWARPLGVGFRHTPTDAAGELVEDEHQPSSRPSKSPPTEQIRSVAMKYRL